MILIKKQSEPHQWTAYKKTTGATYQSQSYLSASLLEEQGYICAYCMRRIPCKDSLCNEDHRIEHINPRSKYPDNQLDYNNMVIVCPGHMGDNDHCDRSKGDKKINLSPLNSSVIQTISYGNNGLIKSSNPVWNRELNDILNLNDKVLVKARKTTLEAIIKQLNIKKKEKKDKWTKNMLKKYLDRYQEKHSDNGKKKYYPYCGIVIYYLQKKLTKM
ncbi:hypothetical protein [Prevotella jejuni]|uniref:hypothetical protein n=1 Tax=Prevotella jejuni TaxID=1177574 RepID=UPI001BA4F52B|nr:hypothetical protein [Prevotella jejuni]QUB82131.1 hypothetical protein J5A63_14515 [Prevotella jejuni]